jgi:two-component system sensor histidine kinase/response regulator
MRTILLIDDDKQIRTTFGLGLRQSGYHVIEAESGGAGLKMAQEFLPDLILTDINMPGGDGSTLLRDIRRDPELRSRQVVLMTGRPDLVPPRRGMEEGADDFLVKPVSLEALKNCMAARLNRASISWRVEDQMLVQLRSSIPSNLPHEFFTPLTGIIGLTEILQSELCDFSPEVQEIHNDIHQSALRLHRTLRNYLLILDLQTERAEVAVPFLSPCESEKRILAGVRQALRLNERSQDVTISAKGSSVLIRPDDLSQIVEELVDNACKFSRQGTPVKIEFGINGKLTVSDCGRGLTAEEISRVGAFRQFDRKKYEQQGLGLGLVLVQKLAAQCKAEFSMKSDPGVGTEVEISFAGGGSGPGT